MKILFILIHSHLRIQEYTLNAFGVNAAQMLGKCFGSFEVPHHPNQSDYISLAGSWLNGSTLPE